MFRVGVDGSPHIKKIRKENQLESAEGRMFSLNKSPDGKPCKSKFFMDYCRTKYFSVKKEMK